MKLDMLSLDNIKEEEEDDDEFIPFQQIESLNFMGMAKRNFK